MAEGKYFFIKSSMSGLVLDVEGENSSPGTRVITWHQKGEGSCHNQLWYVDHITGTIRSQMNNFCLDINDGANQLILNPYNEETDDQKWAIEGDKIYNRKDHDRVLDVAARNQGQGARICAWRYHGEDNQQWSFEHIPAKHFHIRSLLHDKVLDVKYKDPEPGTKVIVMERDEGLADSQLWYENRDGFICCKLNDFVLDASDGKKVKMQPYEAGNEMQRWAFDEERIVTVDNRDQVLDIKGAKTKNGAKVIPYEWNEGDNQKWARDELL